MVCLGLERCHRKTRLVETTRQCKLKVKVQDTRPRTVGLRDQAPASGICLVSYRALFQPRAQRQLPLLLQALI